MVTKFLKSLFCKTTVEPDKNGLPKVSVQFDPVLMREELYEQARKQALKATLRKEVEIAFFDIVYGEGSWEDTTNAIAEYDKYPQDLQELLKAHPKAKIAVSMDRSRIAYKSVTICDVYEAIVEQIIEKGL